MICYVNVISEFSPSSFTRCFAILIANRAYDSGSRIPTFTIRREKNGATEIAQVHRLKRQFTLDFNNVRTRENGVNLLLRQLNKYLLEMLNSLQTFLEHAYFST